MAARRPPVVWSSAARDDLSSIWIHYRGVAGVGVADRIVLDIVQACVLLEDHPLGGRSRDEIRPGLRSVAVSPHVVFYRVRNDVAEIVRALDGRQDLDEVLALENS